MARENAGIREVAAAAGVSVTTVSHALSGRGQVSDETKRRVKAAADSLGYAPNRIARALRSQRSNLLGFVSEEIATTPYAGQILVGAQEAAAELGLMLMIVNVKRGTIDDPQIDALVAQQVDAMIYASSSHRVIRVPPKLDPARTVLVDAYDPAITSPAVVPDELGIGLLATRRLLEAGHRRIVHLTVDEDVPAVDGRERGYLEAMDEAGCPPVVVRVPGPATAGAGYTAIGRALETDGDLTGIFAFNDQMAMGVYQAVGPDRDLSIPRDLSVVGVDDLRLIADALRPGLSTVALPHAEMGRRAVELASRLPLAKPRRDQVLRLPGRLIERESIRQLGSLPIRDASGGGENPSAGATVTVS
ncbi:HTH-type transcriptional regulator DegA [Frondihabitans sp. 762G35]|uniref:LacI family DNA-binding transcriptional regulator n=1 Tax=Frondihabitans sp. 762G35 TaxID=1446794 RepID=UPI000D2118B2|nr:LacI family DNA-binding transcriptional regulator [Frondihabitans sp. 762G35]ARC55933.1 HTH-type transcriptional regulator DegA [Frondihabitans sp. 762G35]